MQAPEATFYEPMYFDRKDFPYATGRSIWQCGEYFFLVSSVINEEMNVRETMVFQCNICGDKTNGSHDLAFSPDPWPLASEIKELVQRAYLNLNEENLRESIEHFVRYEATPAQLKQIKDAVVNG